MALFAILAGCSPGDRSVRTPRHIILISIDTLRQDHVGHYGYERDTTPNLDALASEALIYERAYTTWTWTLLAHMSLLTGLYPSQHGVWRKDASLPADSMSLAERLSAAGFHTIGLHFPGWLDPSYGFARGFNHYESHQNAEEAEEHMRAALAARPKDASLLLFVHLFDVHNGPLSKEKSLYDPPAPFDTAFLPGAREQMPDGSAKDIWYKDGSVVSPAEHAAIVALYDGGIRYVDSKIGQWIEIWKAEGIFEDALFILTSDHGEGLFQRGDRYGGHGEYYEEGLVVPLMMRFPNMRFGGERVTQAVSHIDLVPTILDALDLPPASDLPGYSLLAGRPKDALVIAEHPRKDAEVMYLWPHKLVQSPQAGTTFASDLERDPFEEATVPATGADFQSMGAALRALAAQERARWIHPGKAGTSEPMDPEAAKWLEQIGYGGESDY